MDYRELVVNKVVVGKTLPWEQLSWLDNDQNEDEKETVDLTENNLTKLLRCVLPHAGCKSQIIYLDSNYQQTDVPSVFSNKWNITFSNNVVSNAITVRPFRGIIGMRLYTPTVYLPPLGPDDFVAEYGFDFLNLLIEEFSAQAFQTATGRRFHFVIYPNIIPLDGSSPPAFPYGVNFNNSGYYWFQEPFDRIQSLSLSFAWFDAPVDTRGFDRVYRNITGIELFYLQDD